MGFFTKIAQLEVVSVNEEPKLRLLPPELNKTHHSASLKFAAWGSSVDPMMTLKIEIKTADETKTWFSPKIDLHLGATSKAHHSQLKNFKVHTGGTLTIAPDGKPTSPDDFE